MALFVRDLDGCEWRTKKTTIDPDRLIGRVVYAAWPWQLRPLTRLWTDCSRLASWSCHCGHSMLGKRAVWMTGTEGHHRQDRQIGRVIQATWPWQLRPSSTRLSTDCSRRALATPLWPPHAGRRASRLNEYHDGLCRATIVFFLHPAMRAAIRLSTGIGWCHDHAFVAIVYRAGELVGSLNIMSGSVRPRLYSFDIRQ
jgi:hypothetical protein